MIDLLAAIVQTDPAPIAGWMLLLLALGMYPLGILLPCSSCCGCPNCPTGTLPETVTVTFPEWDDEMLGVYRHRLNIGANVLGVPTIPPGMTKPSARVSETVDGAITQVEILDGGSGFATIGRVAPTLTLSGGGGTGATFTPTLSSSGTPAVWALASATASGGSGYFEGSLLTITAAEGDTTVTAAKATVLARGEPTITATVPGGTGATLAVTLSKNATTPPTWSVANIAVTNGGSGYANNASVSFSIGGATQVTAAAATVSISAGTPAVEIDASDAGGTGATFSVVWNEPYGDDFVPYSRTIQSITVTSGGSGYDTADGPVVLRILDDTTVYGFESFTEFSLAVTITAGAIVSVDGIVNPQESESTYGVGDLLWLGGSGSTGPIESVQLTKGGSYYLPTGAAYGVTVTGGGSYYREDKNAPAYVPVMKAIVENGGTYGCTPDLTPVVDDDPYSETFGQVTSVTINDGGCQHSYRTLNIGKRCCKSIFGGRTFVLKRDPGDPCQFVYQQCEGFGTTRIVLTVPGNSPEYGPQPPYLETESGDGAATLCFTRWTATTLVPDCSDFEFQVESGSRVATVVPGGTYTAGTMPGMCSRCCTSGTLPDEIEVELESITAPGSVTPPAFDGWEGTYVLESGGSIPAPPTSAAWSFGGEIPGKGPPTIEAIANGWSFGLATLSSSGTPTVYTVTGVTIMDPFTSGFSVGTPVTFRVIHAGPGTGSGIVNAAGYVSSVDANGKILAVTITNGGVYEGYRLTMQVQFQHCGEAATPPGIRKEDPALSTDLVAVRGFQGASLRQSLGITTGDFERPTSPPPPYPEGWPCPPENISTPYATDGFPGTAVASQDYVSHCGTDCTKRCFLIARVVRSAGSQDNLIATPWDESKPGGTAKIHAEQAGRPSQVLIPYTAPPDRYAPGYLNKILAGYTAFFSYFHAEVCGGAWNWVLPEPGARPGYWELGFPPFIDIADTWPGRDLSQATCAACESNLCNLGGREIVLSRLVSGQYSDYGRLTIQ